MATLVSPAGRGNQHLETPKIAAGHANRWPARYSGHIRKALPQGRHVGGSGFPTDRKVQLLRAQAILKANFVFVEFGDLSYR